VSQKIRITKQHLYMFWTMWKIVHFVIERFDIQSTMNFRKIKIDDVSYIEFNNVSVYDIIRDKLVENKDMLSSILTE
jgi:hypothetical protein